MGEKEYIKVNSSNVRIKCDRYGINYFSPEIKLKPCCGTIYWSDGGMVHIPNLFSKDNAIFELEDFTSLYENGYTAEGNIIVCSKCKKWVAHMNKKDAITHWNSI